MFLNASADSNLKRSVSYVNTPLTASIRAAYILESTLLLLPSLPPQLVPVLFVCAINNHSRWISLSANKTYTHARTLQRQRARTRARKKRFAWWLLGKRIGGGLTRWSCVLLYSSIVWKEVVKKQHTARNCEHMQRNAHKGGNENVV